MVLGAFRHEAIFYEGLRGFGDWILSFITGELAAGAIVLVMADASQTAMIRDLLGTTAEAIRFEDPRALGTNPGRLLPRWTDFVAEAVGTQRRLVGVGALRYQRTLAERMEAELHEALLNVAFAEGATWRLVCPYDISEDGEAFSEARRTHPAVIQGDRVVPSPAYLGVGAAALTMCEPLPKPPGEAAELSFDRADLPTVRDFLRTQLYGTGLPPGRADDLLLATHEAATNCVRHGGSAGRIHVWGEDHQIICEVAGNGRITDPLVGRRRPDPSRGRGLGLWIVNQVCDLVQIRSGAEGTTIRMHMRPVP
jgi:anti-sigma regulatory factor (Ser/Thr protein kinase)